MDEMQLTDSFRLDLHRFFGGLRIIFHLGTHVLFGVWFTPFLAAVGALFCLSPFNFDKNLNLREIILRLPPIDIIWGFIKKKAK